VINLGDLMLAVEVDAVGSIKAIRSIQKAARTAAQQQQRDQEQLARFYARLFGERVAGERQAGSVQRAEARFLARLREQERRAYIEGARRAANAEAGYNRRNAEWWVNYRRRRQALLRAETAAYVQDARLRSAADRANAEWWMSHYRRRRAMERAETAAYVQDARLRSAADRANAEWWMSHYRRRRAMERAETAAYVQDARLRSAADRANAEWWMSHYRRRRAMERAETAAYVQDARLRAAADRQAAAVAAAAQRASRARVTGAAMALRGGSGLSTVGITSTVAGTFAARGLLRAIDDVQVMRQRLAQVIETAGDARVVMDELTASASRLRVPVGDATELFVKLRQSNGQLGLSMGETLTVTNAFAAALRISGAQGQTAASALLQFGQAMAKGKLDGDEFRTVAENASEVLRVMERQTGLTRGELLKMREAGQLTAKMLSDALIAEAKTLNDRVAKLAPTMTQAATVFRNSMLQMIGNSRDLEEATGNVARSIISFGNTISENSQTVANLGGLALKLGAATVAARLLASAVGAIGTIPAALIGGAVLPFVARAYGEGQRADARANRIKTLVNEGKRDEKALADLTSRLVAAQTRYRAAQDEAARLQTLPVGPERNALIARSSEIAREARESEQAYRELAEALTLASRARAALLSGGSEVTSPAGDPETIKDTTDEFLRAAQALADARALREQDFGRLQQIAAAERRVLEENTASTERLATAYGRLSSVADVMRTFYSENEKIPGGLAETTRRVDVLIDRFDLLFSVMSAQDVRDIVAEKDRLTEKLRELDFASEEYVDTLERILEISNLLSNADPFRLVSGDRNRRLGRAARDIEDMVSQMRQSLEDEILSIQINAPGDLFTAFFTGLGEQWVQGGTSLRNQMLGTIGNIFMSMGAAMVKYGILQTKLAKALVNPITAGPAAIAIGGAMVALGAALSSAFRSGGRDTSGFGGGIGGLGVGGDRTMESVYRFDDRPYQSGGTRTASGSSPVIVNATIIGPNDPNAQRQIAQLVDNAARRGLMQGGGMRT
jgi:tape measure domain-containing protein